MTIKSELKRHTISYFLLAAAAILLAVGVATDGFSDYAIGGCIWFVMCVTASVAVPVYVGEAT